MSKVNLVWSTPDGENLIAYMARVSNPTNQNNKETSHKLIKYLISNKHWSPFEMVNVCMEIETTRDIARQMLRHRSFSFQEFSQRYAEVYDVGEISQVRLQVFILLAIETEPSQSCAKQSQRQSRRSLWRGWG